MKKTTLAIAAVVAVALALTGCARVGATERGDGDSRIYYPATDVEVLFVPLGDGTTVRCIDSGRGLSCDWEGVK